MTTPADTARRAILGIPYDPGKKPERHLLVQAFEEQSIVAGAANTGSIVKDTKANLDLVTAAAVGQMAWVVSDSTAANNGIYENTGTSSATVWTRRTDIPQGTIPVTDLGAGTANAIVATTGLPVPAAFKALFVMSPFEANTDAVTIALNGGAAKPLKTNSGGDLEAGYLTAAGLVAFVDDGTSYRLMSDVASAAIQAAAEAAEAAAEAARDKAELWADEAENVPVEGAQYSAKHHALKSAASATASAASAAAAVQMSETLPRADRATIKALNTATYTVAYLTAADVQGFYDWDATLPIALHQSDPSETDYIAPNPAADGAWVRRQSIDPADCAAFVPAKRKINLNTGTTTFLFLGDSTYDGSTEPPRLFANFLALLYPTHTVNIYYSDGTSYGSATVIQTGTGSAIIDVYVAAVTGYRLSQWMGSRFAHAIEALTPDLIIISTGLNISGLNSRGISRALHIEAIQQILVQKPGTPIAFHLPNPLRTSDNMINTVAGIRDACAWMPGLTIIDGYSPYIATGKPLAWYADSTHPNSVGIGVLMRLLKRMWIAAGAILPPPRAFDSWLADRAKFNILYNGDFAAFASALPDSWGSEGGTGTASKDTVDHFTGKTYSLKIDSTAAKYVRQILDATQLAFVKGKVLSLAARLKATSGGDASTGRVFIQTDGTGAVSTSTVDIFYSLDGYCWKFIDNIRCPADATYFRVFLYGSAGAGASIANFDEVILYVGDGRPREARPV